MTDKLWVFVGTAVASDGCGYPLGEKHAVLIFATAADREIATVKIRMATAVLGWRETEISQSGEIPHDLSTVEDSTLRAAAKAALDQGYGIVVYSDPIPVRGPTI